MMVIHDQCNDIIYFSAGQRQPDNREQVQQGGEEEACMAVLNNFYGDGKLKYNQIYVRYQYAMPIYFLFNKIFWFHPV